MQPQLQEYTFFMYTLYSPDTQRILSDITLLERVRRLVLVLSSSGIDILVDYDQSLSKSLLQIGKDIQDTEQLIHFNHSIDSLELRLDFADFWANMQVVQTGQYVTVSLGIDDSKLYINQVLVSPQGQEDVLALQHQVLRENQLGHEVNMADSSQEYYLVDVTIIKNDQELDSLFVFLRTFSLREYNFSAFFEMEFNCNHTRGQYIKAEKRLPDGTRASTSICKFDSKKADQKTYRFGYDGQALLKALLPKYPQVRQIRVRVTVTGEIHLAMALDQETLETKVPAMSDM